MLTIKCKGGGKSNVCSVAEILKSGMANYVWEKNSGYQSQWNEANKLKSML